jgi:hypothetical protein
MARLALRRTGRRPLQFDGRVLHRDVWQFGGGGFVLGLHDARQAGLVCEAACMPGMALTTGLGLWPWFAAEPVADMDSAMSCFEAMRPDTAGGADAALLRRLAAGAALSAGFAQAVGAFLLRLECDCG